MFFEIDPKVCQNTPSKVGLNIELLLRIFIKLDSNLSQYRCDRLNNLAKFGRVTRMRGNLLDYFHRQIAPLVRQRLPALQTRQQHSINIGFYILDIEAVIRLGLQHSIRVINKRTFCPFIS